MIFEILTAVLLSENISCNIPNKEDCQRIKSNIEADGVYLDTTKTIVHKGQKVTSDDYDGYYLSPETYKKIYEKGRENRSRP